jgi:hypothetical protein
MWNISAKSFLRVLPVLAEVRSKVVRLISASTDSDTLQKLSMLRQKREHFKEAALNAKKEGDRVSSRPFCRPSNE